MGFWQKLAWELGFGPNLGWELGFGTPLHDPLDNGSPQQSKPGPIKRMNSKPKEKYMELNGAQMQ